MTPASMHATRAAIISLLLGAAIIGTNGMMVQWAGTPPTISAFWRMLFAAGLLAAWIHAGPGWVRLPRSAWGWLAMPAIAFAIDLWMWHRSILIVGPGLSTLLANAQVFFVALAGVLLFGERLHGRFIIGVLLAFFGLWLLLGADWARLPAQYRWGVWLGLATGVAYACYNIGIKRAQQLSTQNMPATTRVPIEQILCIVAFGSALCLGIMGMVEGSVFAIPSWHTFGILFALAAFGHCLAWVLISRSIVVLPLALVGLLLLLQPIVAYLLDVLLLQHPTTPRQWAGLAVSLAGIFVAGLKTARRAETPED